MNKILCILQARMSSTRLPGKVLMKINALPLLQYELDRLKKSKLITNIVVATSTQDEDDEIEYFCSQNRVDCFRWELSDVLKRYYDCASKYKDFNTIVRVTWDCPLIDSDIIDETINLFLSSNVDYCSNTDMPTFPDGLDIEVFSRDALEKANLHAILPSEREHVTPYIKKHFRKINYALEQEDYSSYRFTVDEIRDFELISLLIQELWSNQKYIDYVEYIDRAWININNNIIRNEWSIKSQQEDFKFLKNN